MKLFVYVSYVMLVTFFSCSAYPKAIEDPSFKDTYLRLLEVSYLQEQSYESFVEYKAQIPGVSSSEITFDGRLIRLSEPINIRGKAEKLPLIISLHGMGSNIVYQNHFFNAARFIGDKQFVLVIPSGIKRAWDFFPHQKRDRDFILELIKKLKQNYDIDSKRIYLVGHSNGGIFALNLACRLEGIAGVIGINTLVNYHPIQCIKKPFNVTLLHGLEDSVIKYSQGRKNFRKMGNYNGCDTNTTHTKVSLELEHTFGIIENFNGCVDGIKTELYTLVNQTHSKPLSLELVDKILSNLLKLELHSQKKPL